MIEGIGFATRAILDAFRAAGYAGREITAGGGAAASPLWMQILAAELAPDLAHAVDPEVLLPDPPYMAAKQTVAAAATGGLPSSVASRESRSADLCASPDSCYE